MTAILTNFKTAMTENDNANQKTIEQLTVFLADGHTPDEVAESLDALIFDYTRAVIVDPHTEPGNHHISQIYLLNQLKKIFQGKNPLFG